jgi:hypothetical protein
MRRAGGTSESYQTYSEKGSKNWQLKFFKKLRFEVGYRAWKLVIVVVYRNQDEWMRGVEKN